jgi:hypothetical protein
LTRAISQVINNEHQKARIQVLKMVETGMAAGDNPTTILCNILDWCKGETK